MNPSYWKAKESLNVHAAAVLVKPDVVLYGEGLDQNVIRAVNAIGNADMLIVGGTSLVVYPAAGAC